jgi:hypothetical protein
MNFRAHLSLLTPHPVTRSRVVGAGVGVNMARANIVAIGISAGTAFPSNVAPPAV